jgi:glycosyltransferase involved in cell wall biosynthesis
MPVLERPGGTLARPNDRGRAALQRRVKRYTSIRASAPVAARTQAHGTSTACLVAEATLTPEQSPQLSRDTSPRVLWFSAHPFYVSISRRGANLVSTKLVIITELMAPYRIPVFNALALQPEINLEIIFLSENDPTLRRWLVYKDEIQFRYSVLPSWRRRIGKYHLLLNRRVRATLNGARPDVLICGGYNYLACWTAARWARRHHVPFFLWTESTASDRRNVRLVVEILKKKFLNFCAAFVVPGKSSLNYLKELGIGESRVFTAPNAVDTALFSTIAVATRQDSANILARLQLPSQYFLYAGRLVQAKGIFDLLDAYNRLSADIRQTVGLVFVGDGADRPELMAQAAQMNSGKIQVLDFLQREHLAEIYALASALVFPTHSDPWGLVVNEAMACGLPVIATSVAGCTPDLITDGWNGLVVPPRDSLQLAAAMEKLSSNSNLRIKMGQNSRERIEAYSPNAWARGMAAAALSTRNSHS